MAEIISIIWFGVGFCLWASYKLGNAPDTHEPCGGPCQCTFLGSLTWPFYLWTFLWDEIEPLFRTKIHDK